MGPAKAGRWAIAAGRTAAPGAVAIGGAAALVLTTALAGGASPALAGTGAAAGTISTVAGGTGGPGKATTVGISPCAVSSAGGALFMAGGPVVWKVSPADHLTTVAGIGGSDVGSQNLGHPALSTFVDTCAVAVDHAGNLLIADVGQGQIPKVLDRILVVPARTGTFYGQKMRAGRVYSIAGNGRQDAGGSGVPATQTELGDPAGVAVDAHGNVVISDSGFEIQNGPSYASRVRVVAAHSGTFYGRAMKAGYIYTVAGRLSGHGYAGDGGPAAKAALGDSIGAVYPDAAGNLVLADDGDNVIRVIAVKTGTFYGRAMKAGDIYTVAGDGTRGYSGDGGPATHAELDNPSGVAVDAAGNLVVGDGGNHRVRVAAVKAGTFYGRAMKAGDIYTVAGNGTAGFSGDGGPAASAELSSPGSVAVDAAGNLVIGDSGNERVRVAAVKAGTFYGRAMKAGDIYTVAGTGALGYSGDGGPATSAELNNPTAVTSDAAGNMMIADTNNQRVRMVAVKAGTFYGRAMKAGDIYTVAGDGTQGYSGDGGPAASAELGDPSGVAVDAAGNLVIGDLANQRIRVVAAQTGDFYGQAMKAGDIYTVAGDGTEGYSGDGGPAASAELFDPWGVTVDAAGNLVIADTLNFVVRVVAAKTGTFYGQAMTAGDIYTVAGDGVPGYSGDGGPATSAELSEVNGVAVDAAGNLVIADTSNNERIRVVAAQTGTFYGQAMTAGDIYTVAGNGNNGYSGDGGPATSAELDVPRGVAVDAAGNLVIADTANKRIRVVAAQTGTFYGIAMTAGDIYTVAGNGRGGYSGDGGPATGAQLDWPNGVAITPAGDLLIADTYNNRIRSVTGAPTAAPRHQPRP